MEGRVKFLGHSVHPILIVFPLGLLATATIFDVLYLVTGRGTLAQASYWMLAAGVLGGLAAALFGWIDWFAIPSGTRAKRIGLAHGGTNVAALVIFGASFLLRYDVPERPPMIASILAIAGSCLALMGGWLGGELVERLGISVHEGAHVNAPSSLTTNSPVHSKSV